MEFLALLSNRDDAVIQNIKKALGKYTVYPLKTVEELEDLYSNIPLSLLIIDASPDRLSSVENLLNRIDDDMVVIIMEDGSAAFLPDNLPRSVFDCIAVDFTGEDLPAVVERALEKQRLKSESGCHTPDNDEVPDYCVPRAEGRYAGEKIICQKEFMNNVLASMSSGMIAVDRDEKITIFNRLAAEILNLDPSDIIGCDPGALPSPLGDILCETMITGVTFRRHEALIHPLKLPLGINSFRLVDEQHKPVGAGIIFSDLSDFKELEEQGMREEKLRAVNDLVAKIAHEIRNPLTSIQTYTQLLNEKFTDDKLKDFFISSVSRSINRLDNLIDKLITFSSTQDYNFNEEGVNDVLCEAAEFISKNIPGTHRFSIKMFNRSFYVHADKKQLIKAIYYLVLNIVDGTPDGTLITMSAGAIMSDVLSVVISIKYRGEESIEKGKKNLSKPLLDIDNLGAGLNVPISHKIIEGHNGSLDTKSEDGTNSFIIRLPILERKIRYGFN